MSDEQVNATSPTQSSYTADAALDYIEKVEAFVATLADDTTLPARASNAAFSMLPKLETLRGHFRQVQLRKQRESRS